MRVLPSHFITTNDGDKNFVRLEIHGRVTNKHNAFLPQQTTSIAEAEELSIVQYEVTNQDIGFILKINNCEMELKLTAARISMARSVVGPAFGVVKRHFLTFQLFALTHSLARLFSPSNRHSQLTGRCGKYDARDRQICRCYSHVTSKTNKWQITSISLAIYPH